MPVQSSESQRIELDDEGSKVGRAGEGGNEEAAREGEKEDRAREEVRETITDLNRLTVDWIHSIKPQAYPQQRQHWSLAPKFLPRILSALAVSGRRAAPGRRTWPTTRRRRRWASARRQILRWYSALVIYPFVIQFVRETGITGGDDTKIGFYAGILESAFCMAESWTVLQFGRLSDIYGRSYCLRPWD
ncbi:hypothetical protein B0H14DRAFT_2749921 [Mycena olivaceomarginata]|nr:hypothetical protein B0H14DRAFT_2749921 [Mycena olivaceomarginata]